MKILEDITSRLQEINRILATHNPSEGILFGDAIYISKFIKDYGLSYYKLMGEILSMTKKDEQKLYNNIKYLSSVINIFISIDLRGWQIIDFKKTCEAHLKPYRDRWEAAREPVNKTEKLLSSISNRMDYMSIDDEEFIALDKELERIKIEYSNKKHQLDMIYKEYDQEKQLMLSMSGFKIASLEDFVSELKTISDIVLPAYNNIDPKDGISYNLHELTEIKDYISLPLCLFVYLLCQNKQISDISFPDFINAMNLKDIQHEIKIIEGEKLRIYHMIDKVSMTIEDVNASKFWRKQIIQIFKIDESNFNKYHTSATRTNSSAKDKKFVKYIDEAIKEAKNIERMYPLQKIK